MKFKKISITFLALIGLASSITLSSIFLNNFNNVQHENSIDTQSRVLNSNSSQISFKQTTISRISIQGWWDSVLNAEYKDEKPTDYYVFSSINKNLWEPHFNFVNIDWSKSSFLVIKTATVSLQNELGTGSFEAAIIFPMDENGSYPENTEIDYATLTYTNINLTKFATTTTISAKTDYTKIWSAAAALKSFSPDMKNVTNLTFFSHYFTIDSLPENATLIIWDYSLQDQEGSFSLSFASSTKYLNGVIDQLPYISPIISITGLAKPVEIDIVSKPSNSIVWLASIFGSLFLLIVIGLLLVCIGSLKNKQAEQE